jgi:3-oxo-5-alpha-steroid 4-dehydrogenase 1
MRSRAGQGVHGAALWVCSRPFMLRWYTGDPIYDTVLAAAFALVPLTVIGLLFMKAPYGRFAPAGGIGLSPKLGWFLMELPATLSFWFFYLQGPRRAELVPMILAGLWGFHYLNRGFLFPLLMRVPKGAKGTFGALVVSSGLFVTSMHGYLNATLYSRLGAHLTEAWLSDPRFWIGLAIYFAGFALNVHSDHVLRGLRTKAELESAAKVYRIPHGGGYTWVSSPSYLGELIAWTGFAIFTWGLPGVFIFLITAANLVPRAISTHRWYKERFEDYPRERRALIPYVW